MARTIAEKLGIQLPMWHDKAACRNYPDSWWLADKYSKNNTKKAKEICETCPVKDTCLAWARRLERTTSMAGVYGGMTQQERREIRICMHENCDKPVQKINTKPRAHNNYCSLECKALQEKLVVHRERDSHVNKPTEYYMKGILHHG